MKLTVTIDMDNAAFEDYENELGHVLDRLVNVINATSYEPGEYSARDSNGNTAVRATLTTEAGAR